MTRLPTIFALRALEAAARLNSYSAAARELAVTQGAISQQIRKLEAELGVRLFQRRGNQMRPTDDAIRLAEEVRASMGNLQTAIDELVLATEQDPLVLSVESRFAQRWLAPKLPRLLAHPAGSKLEVRVEERVADFASDGVDVVARFGRGDWPGLHTVRLTTDCFVVVCTPAFAALHQIKEAKDLLSAPLIHSTDRPWSMLFERHRLMAPPMAGLMVNDSILTLESVARGLGAALIRSSMVEEDLREGRLVRPVQDAVPLPLNYVRPGKCARRIGENEPPPPEWGYFLAWPINGPKQRRIHALRDWLVTEAYSPKSESSKGVRRRV